MVNARDDIIAIEAAADLIVQALNRADISSLADLVTETTVMLGAGRRTARGRAALELLRNIAQGNEGFRLMSSRVDALAAGVVRDIGTLSMRRRRSGERNAFRYMMVWLQADAGWTLAAMTWNRDAQSEDGGRGAAPAVSATPEAADEGLGGM